MKLEDLGYNDKLEKSRVDNNLKDFGIGKVVSEHKEQENRLRNCQPIIEQVNLEILQRNL